MTLEEITEFVTSLEGVLVQRPTEGDGSPQIAWGDVFFHYSPDGEAPRTQPFATIVTKDYPDEVPSGLNQPGAFRVNVGSGKDEFVARIGREPRAPAGDLEPLSATDDVVFAHPTYGTLGWLAVKNPGPATESDLRELITKAHSLARARFER
ncbi:DUF6194 family protein [Kineosporia rhizophila]|uniref:DUF6194 family protein n=1 Tax=Kineosporia rhizophila TaxID=84633 RepID=UPI001E31C6EC|nr:DUF6194 family protein [Kineosporia rhizophila]MCE0537415.1 DUF6194 family protein [Kineosporia rhizophila]